MKNPFKLIPFLAFVVIVNAPVLNAQLDSELSNYLPNYATVDPSGLYNGVPQINIPLYTLQGRGISIPVSVSYDASGIKVTQEATSIGLGWVLNAGGHLIHETRDWFDFSTIERLSNESLAGVRAWFDENDTSLAETIGPPNEYLNRYDNLPDIFYYQCNGLSGKFILASDFVTGISLPESTAKIRRDPSSGDITITGEDGIQYRFNQVDFIGPNFFRAESLIFVLEQIITPLLDTVDFTYYNSEYTKLIYSTMYDSYSGENYMSAVPRKMPIELLKEISLRGGESIEIEFGERRIDCFPSSEDSVPRIKRIKLRSSDNTVKRYFELYHSYFSADSFLQYLPYAKFADGSDHMLKGSYWLEDNGEFVFIDSVYTGSNTTEEEPAYATIDGDLELLENYFCRGPYIFTRENDTVWAVLNDAYLSPEIPDFGDLVPYDPEYFNYNYENWQKYEATYLQLMNEYFEEANNNPPMYLADRVDSNTYYFQIDTHYAEVIGEYFCDIYYDEYRPFYRSNSKQKRLKLVGLKEFSGDALDSLPAISFSYNSTNLPSSYSSDIDHWGYYNYIEGQPNLNPINTKNHSVFEDCHGLQYYHLYPYRGNRNANEAKMKACILEQIDYPMGGYVKFDFEANRAIYYNSDADSSVTVGGLRIKSLERSTGNGTKYFTRYDYKQYSDLVIGGVYRLEPTGLYSGYLHAKEIQYEIGTGFKYDVFYQKWELQKSGVMTSVLPLVDTKGGPVGYSQVAVINEDESGGNNGFTLYKFHANEPLQFLPITSDHPRDNGEYNSFMKYTGPPVPSNPLLGTTEEIIVCDAWGRIISKTSNSYSLMEPNYKYFTSGAEYTAYYQNYIHSYTKPVGYGGYVTYIDPSEWLHDYELYNITSKVPVISASYNYQYFPDQGTQTADSAFFLFDSHGSQCIYDWNIDVTTDVPLEGDYDSLIDAYYSTGPGYVVNAFDSKNTQKLLQKIEYKRTGEIVRTRYWYPPQLESGDTMYQKLVERNMISPVVKVEKFIDGARVQGQKTSYSVFSKDEQGNEDFILPSVQKRYYGSGYQTEMQYVNYNQTGMAKELKGAEDYNSAIIYGFNNSLPIAKISNAEYSECDHLNFEEGNFTDFNWQSYNGSQAFIDTVQRYTGDKSLRIESGGYYGLKLVIPDDNLNVSGSYTLTARFKNIDYSTTRAPFTCIGIYTDGGNTYLCDSTYNTGGWDLTRVTANLSNYQNISAVALFVLSARSGLNPALYGEVYVDDIRFFPADAQMVTYTYDPLVGITSATDPSGKTVKYTYDSFGRKEKVKDSKDNLLQQYDYNYANK